MDVHGILQLDGYSVTPLTRDELPELQLFLERCTGFFELCEGGPTPADAAELQWSELPRGYPAEDHFVFLVRHGEALVALLNLFRNYPRAGQWWLGFQIVDPAFRGRGLGERLVRAMEEWIGSQGADILQLAVSEENAGADRFWRRMGFVETERQAYTTMYQTQTMVTLMRKSVAQSR